MSPMNQATSGLVIRTIIHYMAFVAHAHIAAPPVIARAHVKAFIYNVNFRFVDGLLKQILSDPGMIEIYLKKPHSSQRLPEFQGGSWLPNSRYLALPVVLPFLRTTHIWGPYCAVWQYCPYNFCIDRKGANTFFHRI